MESRHVPVLIVGGGPVGLALAGDLGWRGIPCELIEQGDGSIGTPKMNEVNARTMEFCRRWGIAKQVQDCPFPGDWPLDVVFVTSLSGYELARLRRPPRNAPNDQTYGPVRLQACSQMWFDPILRGFANSFPAVRLRYRTRLESFEEQGVRVATEVIDLISGARARRRRIIWSPAMARSAWCAGARHRPYRKRRARPSAASVLPRPRSAEACGKERGTFFLGIDRDGLWANIRIIDPVNGIWRVMVLDDGSTRR